MRTNFTRIASLWRPKSTGATSVATGQVDTAIPIVLAPGTRINLRKCEGSQNDKAPAFELVVVLELDDGRPVNPDADPL